MERSAFVNWLVAALAAPLILPAFVGLSPGDVQPRTSTERTDPGIFGIVGLDPWYTYNSDPERHPDDVNRTFLEHMMADLAQLGARWVRIEFHAEYDNETGPGPIDYSKHDWFINELAPRHGIKVLAVVGSGLIGDKDLAWGFEHLNEPLNENDTNRYIDEYLNRVREITERYGSNLGAIEVLNEPNASEILSQATGGREKAVHPANYGILLRRTYEIVQESSPQTDVVLGGMLYDTEYETLPDGKDRSYDLDWLESVYGSRPVMTYYVEHGRHPFDAVAVHPYFLDPHEIVEYLEQVRDMQRRFDDWRSRIWITEIGIPADPPPTSDIFGLLVPSADERRQAAFLSSVYTTLQQRTPYVERIFWFKYEDFPLPDGSINGWGLVRLRDSMTNYAGFATPWPRKFAFAVYQALASPRELPSAPVDPPASDEANVRYFPETGHTLRGDFLRFWEQNGGLELLGRPLTEPFQQAGRTVQYFEYARFDHYPEHAGTRWEVQLSLIGRDLLSGRTFERQPPGQGPDDGRLYFSETGQYIIGAFRQFWQEHGGREQFGLPLTPEFEENGVTVQYFERARFEWVPTEDGHEVQLARIGAEILATPGWYR